MPTCVDPGTVIAMVPSPAITRGTTNSRPRGPALTTSAGTPPTVTRLVMALGLKPRPATVTRSPGAADRGSIPVTSGTLPTTKESAFEASAPTAATTVTSAPAASGSAGTLTVIDVGFALTTGASASPKRTLTPGPRDVPVRTTTSPGMATSGASDFRWGAW